MRGRGEPPRAMGRRGQGDPAGAGCKAAHRATARRRDGDIAPYRNGTRVWCMRGDAGRGRGGAKPRTAPMARRREPGAPAAKHRAARVMRGCNVRCAGRGVGGTAMGADVGDVRGCLVEKRQKEYTCLFPTTVETDGHKRICGSILIPQPIFSE